MGADIHCYVEAARPVSNDQSPYWLGIGGRINPGRDYDLFAKIAGVRAYGDDKQLFETRGLPIGLGWAAAEDSRLRVVPDTEEPDEEEVKRTQAESWVASGCSSWIPLNEDKPEYWVSHPDWHSHTWLTPAEFRQVLEAERPEGWEIDPDYFGVLAMMEEVERRGRLVRIVMWFDN